MENQKNQKDQVYLLYLCKNRLSNVYQKENALILLEELVTEISSMSNIYDDLKPINKEDIQNIMDLAIRKLMSEISMDIQKKDQNQINNSLKSVESLLDLSYEAAMKDLIYLNTPYRIIEELMESQTIPICEKVWELVETRKDKLAKASYVFQRRSGKQNLKPSFSLLRCCNSLLRRLSKTKDTGLNGKILLYLATTFPLTERSGVNLAGKFNSKYETEFDDETIFQQTNKDQNVDYTIYTSFWMAQKYFQNYHLIVQDTNEWIAGIGHLDMILDVFIKNPLLVDNLMNSDNSHDNIIFKNEINNSFLETKYLTSSRLLPLQLKDLLFRKEILTQFLILLHHLCKLKQDVIEKAKISMDIFKNKLIEYEKKVLILLHDMPPDGGLYTKTITMILDRERNWINWKNDKCPPPAKNSSTLKKRKINFPAFDSKKKINIGMNSNHGSNIKLQNYKHPSEIMETILYQKVETDMNSFNGSNIANGVYRLLGKQEKKRGGLDYLIEQFQEAWDPENGIEEEFWPKNNKVSCWRTLRGSMKDAINHFDKAREGAEAIVKSILHYENDTNTTTTINNNSNNINDNNNKMDQINQNEEKEIGEIIDDELVQKDILNNDSIENDGNISPPEDGEI